jgi:prepilin-type N-terminal cleavage/methylation domain-containing protein
MDKKKNVKKSTGKNSKRPITKKNEKKKKGFTLIELLAVIIILGILMIIAIPSVTSYISDSRKSAYVDTAKEIVSGTRNLVNEGKLGMYDPTATYYIPADYINTENALKSPYGEFSQAYVGVVYDGKGYKYSWISCDDAGQGVDDVTALEDLDTDDIKSDLNSDEILDRIKITGINGKNNIYILSNGTWEGPYQAERAPGDDIESSSGTRVIKIVTEGKTKDNLEPGDEITIGEEHFNVIKVEGDEIILLAKYNLYVGNKYQGYNYVGTISEDDPNFIKQNSICLGEERGSKMCTLPFSGSCYWTFEQDYKDIYDNSKNAKPTYSNGGYINTENYSVAYYVQLYKAYLEELGANIKLARLMYYSEGESIKTVRDGDNNIFLYNTTFYTSTSVNNLNPCAIYSLRGQSNTSGYWNGGYYNYPGRDGVRPVVIIEKSSI